MFTGFQSTSPRTTCSNYVITITRREINLTSSKRNRKEQEERQIPEVGSHLQGSLHRDGISTSGRPWGRGMEPSISTSISTSGSHSTSICTHPCSYLQDCRCLWNSASTQKHMECRNKSSGRGSGSPQPPPLLALVSTSVNWEETLACFRGMEKGQGRSGSVTLYHPYVERVASFPFSILRKKKDICPPSVQVKHFCENTYPHAC